ncbi:MAG: 4Fe-4S binding protein [Tissierellia bacterium]|nr:4Fe-4S binding protein [Tissierellia bacterium]
MKKLMLEEDYCKGCNICAYFCPKGVLELDPHFGKMTIKHREECIFCGQCEIRCPDFAIYLEEEDHA